MKKINLVFIAVMVFAVSIMSCGGNKTAKKGSPSDVVEKMFKLIEKKDYEQLSKLYVSKGELLTEEEAKKMEGLMGMASEEMSKKEGLKDFEILEETVSEDETSAKVKYKVFYKNGSEDSETAKLSKVDGKWYLEVN